MLFNSWEFLVFFAVVLAVYYNLRLRAQNWFLLLASYFFYSWWDWRFSSLLIISTAMDYLCAQQIQRSRRVKRRKLFLAISMTGNLGMLCTFKYFNFFIDSLANTIEFFGMTAHLPTLQVILPVGISFYTFQTMAYVIDVYRKNVKAIDDSVVFALYVSYFPQLVAGPIERPGNLMGQFASPRIVTEKQLSSGIVLVLIGFVKKLAIADTIAPSVDGVFTALAAPDWAGHVSAASVALAIFLFTLQIYGDFSGYSDIARGVSRILGINLMRNFEQPYLSNNVADFWRRWHISLSTWLKDYLYIPLGGNRGGLFGTCRNLFLTMTIAGLWHGANWTFVVWGALHGAFLVGHRVLHSFKSIETTLARMFRFRLVAIVPTFVLVSFTWLFFRAQNMEVASRAIQAMLNGGTLFVSTWDLTRAGYFTLLVLLLDIPQFLTKKHSFVVDMPPIRRGIALGAMAILLLLFHPGKSDIPFLYFQF